ncbi:MAG TPA: PQQ-binding-like beta-propeller repeat protein [Terrimesophilobacter sp.]|nr:PQQ-binding-like beta-propeller repeat protein [Terrimesophilobacter sp.]
MESPPPERPHAHPARVRVRPASVVAAASMAAVVLVTGVSIAIADNQTTEVLGGAAAKYVPADGHLGWVLDNLGTLRMSESARTIGFNNILQLPLSAGAAVIEDLGDDARIAQLWRESASTVSEGELIQTTELHRLSEEGLTLLAGHGGSVGFAYSPALLELPADVAPGSAWTSAGDALPGGILTYTADFTASEPTNSELIAASRLDPADLARCLQADGRSVYRDSTGAPVLEITESDLWCEGLGRVAIAGTVNGEPIVQGPPAEEPTAVEAGSSAAPPDWDATGDWQAMEAETRYPDAFFGEQQLAVSLANAPQRTDSGLIVAADQNADDVVALRLDSGVLRRQWFAHPGGEIIALATAGDATLVTTSRRRVIAYSDAGQRLWAMDTPELVFAPPTDAGNGSVIVVGLDGIVSSVDLLSGELAWERKLAADVSLAAAVVDGIAVVVDRAGAITAFDLGSGERVWSEDTGHLASSVVTADGAIIVAGQDGLFRAYDAASGTHLWALRYGGFLRSFADLGSSVVLVTNEATIAVEARSGVVEWRRDGAQDAVTDGRRVVLFEEASARLVDAAGASEGEWSIPSLALSIYRYALPGADGFWVFRSNQPALAVGHP